MVFGNKGETSGTGVAFSRNPSTGEKKIYAEYLMNAQGEDVVAGIRTPEDISTLEQRNKAVYDEFMAIVDKLENTIEICRIWSLQLKMVTLLPQTRNGKRTAQAALKIAVDLLKKDY